MVVSRTSARMDSLRLRRRIRVSGKVMVPIVDETAAFSRGLSALKCTGYRRTAPGLCLSILLVKMLEHLSRWSRGDSRGIDGGSVGLHRLRKNSGMARFFERARLQSYRKMLIVKGRALAPAGCFWGLRLAFGVFPQPVQPHEARASFAGLQTRAANRCWSEAPLHRPPLVGRQPQRLMPSRR